MDSAGFKGVPVPGQRLFPLPQPAPSATEPVGIPEPVAAALLEPVPAEPSPAAPPPRARVVAKGVVRPDQLDANVDYEVHSVWKGKPYRLVVKLSPEVVQHYRAKGSSIDFSRGELIFRDGTRAALTQCAMEYRRATGDARAPGWLVNSVASKVGD